MKKKLICVILLSFLCFGIVSCKPQKNIEVTAVSDYEEYCVIFGEYVMIDGKYMSIQKNGVQPSVLERIYMDNEGKTFYFDDDNRVYVKDTYVDIAGNSHTIYNNVERVENMVKID